MNNPIKTILIFIIYIIVIILIDTIQARLFKNSPIISWKDTLSNKDSWVDKGIIMDTYYCTKERDIITVSWHFKTSKFTCPIDDDNITLDKNNKALKNISMIIKDGTLTKTGATIIITDLNETKNTYGEFYRIDKLGNNTWSELNPIIENYGFNSIGYFVDENNKLELSHNWEWLYGKLENGKYRLVKEVNYKYFSVEFEIE